MDRDEILKQLTSTVKEELCDVTKYIEISKVVNNDGYSQIFRDIAHEEYSHAKHIRDIMIDMGMDLKDRDDMNAHFMKAKDML